MGRERVQREDWTERGRVHEKFGLLSTFYRFPSFFFFYLCFLVFKNVFVIFLNFIFDEIIVFRWHWVFFPYFFIGGLRVVYLGSNSLIWVKNILMMSRIYWNQIKIN